MCPQGQGKKRRRGIAGVLLLCVWAQLAHAGGAKNIILMVADGQGFNNVAATDLYTGTPAPFEAFPAKYGMTTYSASNDFTTNPLGYDPGRMWTEAGYPTSNFTDSAAAATAMYTGVKVANGQISWRSSGSLPTFFEIVSGYGKSTGVVSSVQFSHATPGAVAAHNPSRSDYAAIANDMIYNSPLDVIMGAGHPGYDNNGQPATKTAEYAGGPKTWADLTDGDGANGLAFIETRGQFEDLATGVADYNSSFGVQI
jgi:alkaline phosphatase